MIINLKLLKGHICQKTMFWSTAQQNPESRNLRPKNIYTCQYQTLPFSSELQEYHPQKRNTKENLGQNEYKVNTT